MRCEPIEWQLMKQAKLGLLRHSEGAQTTFGLSRARRILKNLGPGWAIVHMTTHAPPPDDQLKEPDHASTGRT